MNDLIRGGACLGVSDRTELAGGDAVCPDVQICASNWLSHASVLFPSESWTLLVGLERLDVIEEFPSVWA